LRTCPPRFFVSQIEGSGKIGDRLRPSGKSVGSDGLGFRRQVITRGLGRTVRREAPVEAGCPLLGVKRPHELSAETFWGNFQRGRSGSCPMSGGRAAAPRGSDLRVHERRAESVDQALGVGLGVGDRGVRAPHGPRPSRIVRKPGNDVDMQLRYPIPERGHVELGRREQALEDRGHRSDFDPQALLIRRVEVEHLNGTRDPGHQNEPRIPRIVVQSDLAKLQVDDMPRVLREAGIELMGWLASGVIVQEDRHQKGLSQGSRSPPSGAELG
jgi:hypothetical protein